MTTISNLTKGLSAISTEYVEQGYREHFKAAQSLFGWSEAKAHSHAFSEPADRAAKCEPAQEAAP